MTFSSAVSDGSSWNDWNTKPTERERSAARSSSSSAKRSVPSSSTLPPVGVSRPARMASSVDLPEPEAPTIATASPAVTLKSISRRMTRSLEPLLTVLPMPRALRIVFFSLLFICLASAAAAAPGKTVLVYGDSLSAAYGMPERHGWVALLQERFRRERPDYNVVNASISGETTSGGLARFDAALARVKPAIVVLELGANDGLRGLPVAAMKKNLAAMIERSQKSGAKVLIVGMQVPPNYGAAYAGAFERAFAEVAKEHKTALLPFMFEGFGEKYELFLPDRLHPTPKAQPLILNNVWKQLAPLLAK